MTQVTQFPGGLGGARDDSLLSKIQSPLPLGMSVYWDDFDTGSNFDNVWTSYAQAGGATPSNPVSASGLRTYTTGATAGDGITLQANQGGGADDAWTMEETKSWFVACRFMIDVEFPLFSIGYFDAGPIAASTFGALLNISPANDPNNAGVFGLIVNLLGFGRVVEVIPAPVAPGVWFEAAFAYDGADKFSCEVRADDGVNGAAGVLVEDLLVIGAPGSPMFPMPPGNPSIHFETGNNAAAALTLDWVAFGGGR